MADLVILKDGARLKADAKVQGVVVLSIDGGEISVDKNDARSMVPSSSRLRELEAREAALGPRDVQGRIRLADWAEMKGLVSNRPGSFGHPRRGRCHAAARYS